MSTRTLPPLVTLAVATVAVSRWMYSRCSISSPRIAVVLLAALAGLSTRVSAQEVRGTLTRSDGVSPASGAIVESRRLRDGDLIARTITDGEGRFRVRVVDELVELRVLRIGWRPVVVDTVKVSVGSLKEIRATVPEVPIDLAPVRSSAETECQQLGQASPSVATVYSEIRTALLASHLYVPDGVPRSRFRLSTADWSADERTLLEEKHRDYLSDSLRPFRSHPPQTLLNEGFVTYDRERNASYRAPDADVLTSDDFLSAYCLRLVEADSSRTGWIGIGFAPTRRNRSTVQVTGTMWASGTPPMLERVEFSYVGLDPISESGRPGGWLEYTSLEDGHWFASRWELRIPRIGAASVVRRRDMRVGEIGQLLEIRVLHGEVLEVSVAGRTSFSSGTAEFIDARGRLVEDSLADPASARPCTTEQGRTFLIGSVGDTAGRPLVGAHLALDWRPQSSGEQTRILGTSRSDGRFLLCDVPADRPLRLQIEARGFEGAAMVVRAPDPQRRIQLDLRLVGTLDPD